LENASDNNNRYRHAYDNQGYRQIVECLDAIEGCDDPEKEPEDDRDHHRPDTEIERYRKGLRDDRVDPTPSAHQRITEVAAQQVRDVDDILLDQRLIESVMLAQPLLDLLGQSRCRQRIAGDEPEEKKRQGDENE